LISLSKIKAHVSIDNIALTTSVNIGEVEPPKCFGGYYHVKDIPIKVLRNKNETTHNLCEKYEKLSEYSHKNSKNRATLCSQRIINGSHNIPSFKVTFESSYHSPLKYKDAKKAIRYLTKKFGTQFRPSEVHLAIDYVMPYPINLHTRICLRIKPGKKYTFDRKGTTHIYGAPGSACRLVIYDKGQQLLSVKNIKVSGDICRVEIRMKIPRLRNFLTSLEDVGDADWSWPYGPHFSFHFANANLISLIGPKAKQKSIWQLRDIMPAD
jgi:hypothetical protein